MAELILSLRDREIGRLPVCSTLTTIGRDVSANLVIDNAAVSRIHAKIGYTGGKFVLRDNASKNGLTVNGQRTREAVLREGDIIGINKFLVRFSMAGGVPPHALARPNKSGRGRPRDLQHTMHLDAPSRERVVETARRDIEKQRTEKETSRSGPRLLDLNPVSDRATLPPPPNDSHKLFRSSKLVLSGVALGMALLAMLLVIGL